MVKDESIEIGCCTFLNKRYHRLLFFSDRKSFRSTDIITSEGNQPNLLKVAIELAESSIAIDTNYHDERLHGRKTTRQIKVYPIPPELLPDWAGAKSLIEVSRYGTRPQGKKSRRQIVDYHERHFYLSSKNSSASEFAEAIRGHWSIENQLHWVKDVRYLRCDISGSPPVFGVSTL
ncbi:ISAs1 family transposase [Nostoc sp. WHI]|uniref:ISAs1 family transposase n=1 Tax=Nostoc sp. WHI TaxID=2650611 RepID=UPI0018C6478C|nr:ISAs1 family transposase [Nostoc sp. WHI]MBG1265922.1 ISAs1 family transposase [Nostoc sp. WHI]